MTTEQQERKASIQTAVFLAIPTLVAILAGVAAWRLGPDAFGDELTHWMNSIDAVVAAIRALLEKPMVVFLIAALVGAFALLVEIGLMLIKTLVWDGAKCLIASLRKDPALVEERSNEH